MEAESNVDGASGDNASKPSKMDCVVDEKDKESTQNDNDIPMREIDSSMSEHPTESTSITQTDESTDIKDDLDSNAKQNGVVQNNCVAEPTQVDSEEVTPGTSANNKSSAAVRRPAGGKPKTNRFAKRNYRSQILSSSSSSSNRSTPELRNRSESTESSNQPNGEREHHSDDDDDLEWDEDDDDDNDSSLDSFDYPHMEASDSEESNASNAKNSEESNKDSILLKGKPNYERNLLLEIINREHGLSAHGLKSVHGRSSLSFQERIYGARQTIEKLDLLHTLQEHDGCVNSLNFNKSGTLLASGSDDLNIILWDWASNKVKFSISSGHHSNVFQTKFVEFGSGGSDINIVSSGRDGQVRYITISPDGGSSFNSRSRVLFKHAGSVHKISPSPHIPYEVLTAGEDGHVFRCDLRENRAEKVCAVKEKKRKVPLYSIAHNPHEPHFCVCGRDQFVRVYDKRNTKESLHMMCPKHLDKKSFVCHITCAVYNSSGSEILASYSDEDIYSFSTRRYVRGEYTHRYRGHNNNKTIKGVNYFGLNSEYVVSGSDCGNFFIWDKETEAIMNWKKADYMGVVNCLEPHPSFPVLATSGLDHDVKIWAPIDHRYPPAMEGLQRCIKSNTRRTTGSNLFDDRTLYFFVRQCLRNRRQGGNTDCPTVEDFSSSDSDGDNNDCDPDENDLQFRSFPPCNPQ